MDEKRMFAVLGLEETRDEEAIKSAYRQKLRLVNPEDDPEGFKQLREAYEAALKRAAQAQEQMEEADDTPSGVWLQKASALYHSLKGRQDGEGWRALFREPEFLDLEEEENCREKLIAFLMKHCYFPTQVWKEIGAGLQVEQEKEKLYEKFPKDFIDFIVRKVQRGEDFEFELLHGPDDGDLDGWIFLFSKAGREENEKNYEAMEETIREAQEKGFTHPGLTMMKARMFLATGRTAEGDALVELLLGGSEMDSLGVQYQTAEYFWESGRTDRAAQIFLEIKKNSKKHYMANRRLAQWYLDRKEWTAAKECVNVLLSYPLDDEGKALVDSINAGLEGSLAERLAQAPDDLKAKMDLGWCYLQDDEPKKAMELMKDVTPAPHQEKDFVNLMGKVYFYGKQYDKAVPLIRRWIELLTEQMPEGGQDYEDDHERLATGHSMLAQIAMEEAKEKEGEKRDAAFELVMRELEAAKAAKYNPGQDYTRASVFLEWGKYEECRGLCEKLRESYPDFAAALILHQKASAKLFDAGAVISDYMALRQLQPDYAESWELAAEVYHQIKRRQDLEKLLADAQENGTLTARLKRYRFFLMVEDAKKKDELLNALEYAKEVGEEGENEGWSEEERADFISERARNYWRINANETALELINQAIAEFPSNLMYTYIKAGIKKDQEAYEEALALYLGCREDYDETAHFYANVGECLYRLGRNDEALPNLKKSVELKPDSPVCCTWIERILRAKMEQSDSLELLEEALHYTELMIKYRNSSFDYIEQGLLWVLAQDYEAAARDFERAVKADDTDPFAHSNLARMYRLLNRLPEAEVHAKLATERMENDPGPYHYEMLGRVYWQMHRYEEAIAAFMENWKRFPERREGFVNNIVSVYNEAGEWQKAVEFLQEFYEEKGRRYVQKTVEVYCYAGLYGQAVKFLHQYYRGAGIDKRKFEWMLADIYWYQGNLDSAAAHIVQALGSASEDDADYPEMCARAAGIYFFMEDAGQAAYWAQKGLQYYQLHGGFAKQLNALDDRLQNMYTLGSLQLYAGNISTAQALAGEMKLHPRCIYCSHCCCTDASELEAGILVAKGDFAGAARIYEEILRESGADRDVRMKLALIRGRI